MPVPLDEFPLHQVPLSLEHVASSDRNAYDRSYFNGHDRTGDLFLITGFGVYPNLGVKDAFALVRRGDQHSAVHFSDAIDDDRLNQRVGAYRIEVLEPLRRLRLICDDASLGLTFDLTWEGSFVPLDEQHHTMRRDRKVILDACRFARVGTWEGALALDGDDYKVDPATWVGTRDRSWGIRPVGEAEPAGKPASSSPSAAATRARAYPVLRRGRRWRSPGACLPDRELGRLKEQYRAVGPPRQARGHHGAGRTGPHDDDVVGHANEALGTTMR